MTSSNRDARPLAGPGARNVDQQLGTFTITSELTTPHIAVQVRRLILRYGLSKPIAEVIASLAFTHGGRA